MNKPDVVEIWLGDQVLMRLDSAMVPREGDLINIQKVTYTVIGVSFSVDQAADPFLRQMRCNVIVELASHD